MCNQQSFLKRFKAALPVVALTVLACSYASAQEEPVTITITSDQAEIIRAQDKSIYLGHVIIKRGKTILKGSELITYGAEKGQFRAVLTGQPATFYQPAETAGDEPTKGHAQKIIYTGNNETIDLLGDAVINQGQDTIHGEKIHHKLGSESYQAEGSADKQVKIIITPSDNQ